MLKRWRYVALVRDGSVIHRQIDCTKKVSVENNGNSTWRLEEDHEALKRVAELESELPKKLPEHISSNWDGVIRFSEDKAKVCADIQHLYTWCTFGEYKCISLIIIREYVCENLS